MLYFYHVRCLPKATQLTPTKLHVVPLSQKIKIKDNEKWKTLCVVSSNEDTGRGVTVRLLMRKGWRTLVAYLLPGQV